MESQNVKAVKCPACGNMMRSDGQCYTCSQRSASRVQVKPPKPRRGPTDAVLTLKKMPCGQCGTPMYRGSHCPKCGKQDKIGLAFGLSGRLFALMVLLPVTVFFALIAFYALKEILHF